MPLITTISEIKAVLPRLLSNLSDTSQLPNFERAEEKHLLPITGRPLYDDISTKQGLGTLNPVETKLLKQMQLVVAAFGLLDELAFGHSKITDGGVRTLTTTQFQKAVGWEYKELKNALLDSGLDGMEVLLAGLVAQNSNLWTASDECKIFKKLLIKTGSEFDKVVKLHQPMRTFWCIRTVVADAQYNYLEQSLGLDLITYLNESAGTDAEKHIAALLKKALAHLSMKHALEHYAARFDINGITVVNSAMAGDDPDTTGRMAAPDMITLKMKAHDRDGSAYLAAARHEAYKLYNDAAAVADFKTAYDAGPMTGYKLPADRDKGNSTRNIFRL